MNFLEELAADRKIFLDAIDANKGDINLDIFEDFYPDEAHFIYELLQNAEDADATEVYFELSPQVCIFEHNGTRHFSESDIKAITGIHSSTKKEEPDKIGKFGVGFKSVFVYTETPVIYSKNFSFRIVKRVLPQSVPPKPSLGEKTRFEFPFDNPKKNVKHAYAEVKAGLDQLSETTLLFLNNLRYISWKIGDQVGAVLREEHSDSHVEILKQLDGKDVYSSHWLRFLTPVQELQRFTAPVKGVELQRVAIAFELAFISDHKSFNIKLPIAEQLKIVPAKPGKVSVFFPAEKETSILRFHLHAPFIPELSRASIKNSPENIPLYEQLARLAAASLHKIKQLDLLTGEFLAVLPNSADGLPKRYQAIREAIILEMQEQPLTPTKAGNFGAAKQLIQAKPAMKDLLCDEDLSFLFNRRDNPTWVISANQTNSPQDRFLSSLGIVRLEADRIAKYLSKYLNADEDAVNQTVMNWLDSKSDEWHQALYAMFYDNYKDKDEYGPLCNAKMVRLTGGGYSAGRTSYFATGPIDPSDPFPRVSGNILTVVTRQAQQANARHFLEKIGVRLPVEADEIKNLIQIRYSETGEAPDDKAYVADLNRFISYLQKNPDEWVIFKDACLFRVSSEKYEWSSAASVYLDTPFEMTGLNAYYGALKPEARDTWPLSSWYQTCGINLPNFLSFAKTVGCKNIFDEFAVQTKCEKNPKWSYLRTVPGERETSPINLDYSMSQRTYDLLRSKSIEFSQLVWVTLSSLKPNYLQAKYQKNGTHGAFRADSQLVHLLRKAEWIPLRDGRFVAPRYATRNDLLEGFTIDAAYKWLDAVEFGLEERTRSTESHVRATKRAELGFKSEDAYRRALAFSQLPEEKQKQILDTSQESKQTGQEEFPERPVRNQDLRAKRVQEQAVQTPEKQSLMRLRSVDEGYPQVKAEAQQYLRDQYTTASGVMFCQVCKAELPFKLPTGAYFFEKQQIADELDKRHYQLHLALCPNHAAMFRFANAQKDEVLDLVANSASREIELVLGGNPATVQFTEMHLADIKACLAADGL